MIAVRTAVAASLLTVTMAVLPREVRAAEVCSAWAEPARVEQQMQLRQNLRMRTDREWVLAVAGNPAAEFGYDGILMSPEEQQEFQAKYAELASSGSQHEAIFQQAMAYAKQHADSFAGGYLRRTSDYLFDPPAALVLMFTGDLAVHEKALQNLAPADIAVEIVTARFSLQQLEAAMETLRSQYRHSGAKDGIRWWGFGPDLHENIITVTVESDRVDAAARIEAGYDGMVKALVFPKYDASKRLVVTEGSGWRLLGRAERRGVAPPPPTQAATSPAAWRELREATQITKPRRSVDFRKEIVLTFAASIGCGELQLDDVVINRSLQSINPKFSHGGSGLGGCGLAYVGYEAFAVAVRREALPPNPITVPNDRSWDDVENPRYCPRGLIIPPP